MNERKTERKEGKVIMAYKDLRSYLQVIEQVGLLKRIKTEVDPHLEITEITHRVTRAMGPALLFENVKGHDIPVAINLFGNHQLLRHAFQVKDMDDLGKNISNLLKFKPPKSLLGKISALGKIKELASIPPRMTSKAPCQEIVLEGDSASLDILPILTCWPKDAGPYITLPMVITKNPETGARNVGMYRLQKVDSKTLMMHWQLHKGGNEHYEIAKKRGEIIPVAIALGADPVTMYAASAPLPPEFDEFVFSGFLRGKPVKLTKTIGSDLEVPAFAEIVLEGYVNPNEELDLEGPFGDHTGFYSLPDYYPRFHLERITMRKDPIYPTTIVGVPPQEDYYLGYATERIFLPFLQLFLPEIVDYHMPPEGIFHNLVFVSIKKRYPGHAYKVINGILGMGLMSLSKIVIVVDHDVNVRNPKEAWWYALNNIDPERDIVFTKGPIDALDHASRGFAFGSKMGIDGTRKWPEEGFTREWPEKIEMSREIKELVTKKWPEYGIKLPSPVFEYSYIMENWHFSSPSEKVLTHNDEDDENEEN